MCEHTTVHLPAHPSLETPGKCTLVPKDKCFIGPLTFAGLFKTCYFIKFVKTKEER